MTPSPRWMKEAEEEFKVLSSPISDEECVKHLAARFQQIERDTLERAAKVVAAHKPGFVSKYPDIQEIINYANDRLDRITAAIRALKEDA